MKFAVGDAVSIIATDEFKSVECGNIGTVVGIVKESSFPYTVEMLKSCARYYCNERELVAVTSPVKRNWDEYPRAFYSGEAWTSRCSDGSIGECDVKLERPDTKTRNDRRARFKRLVHNGHGIRQYS